MRLHKTFVRNCLNVVIILFVFNTIYGTTASLFICPLFELRLIVMANELICVREEWSLSAG